MLLAFIPQSHSVVGMHLMGLLFMNITWNDEHFLLHYCDLV